MDAGARRNDMKTSNLILKLAASAVMLVTGTGCMTTYDAYGRPVQTVDPALAVAGVAAAGLIGYALAEGNDNDDYYHGGYQNTYHGGYYKGYHGNYHYRPAPYYRGGYHGGYHGRPYYRHH
jgi:hypothetical protein